MTKAFLHKVGEIIRGLPNFMLEIANCSFHCPLGSAEGGAFLECLWGEVEDLVYTWANKMESVIVALVINLFKLLLS
jgi:hypothetical protein